MAEAQTAAPPPITPAVATMLAALVVVGGALRVHAALTAPGFWYDEAIYALDGLRVLREPGWPIFFDTRGHMREPLFIYLLAGVFGIFGPSVEAARLVAAAVGTATIAAVFLMAREYFRAHAPALAAAAVVTVLAWHVRFSGLCFRTITAPLLASLSAWALLRAARRRTTRDAAIAGALLGLGAYTYLSWRLVPVMLVLWVAWHGWRDRAALRGPLPRLAGIVAGTALLVAAPLMIHFLRHPDHFRGRTAEVTLRGHERPPLLLVATQARDVALLPLLRGDHVGKHNLPGREAFVQATLWPHPTEAQMRGFVGLRDRHGHGVPLFDPALGILTWVGVGVMGWRAWQGRGAEAAIVVWLGVGALASVLSFGAPNILRLTFLIPAVCLALVEGGMALLQRLEGWLPRRSVLVIVAMLASYGTAWQVRLQQAWRESPLVAREFNPDLVELGRLLATVNTREPLPVLVPALIVDAPTLRFVADGVTLVSDSAAGAPGPRWRELRSTGALPPLRSPAAPGDLILPEGHVFLGQLVRVERRVP